MICNFDKCNETTSIVSVPCRECNLVFCLKHRLPEVHSPECRNAVNLAAHKKHAKDSEQIHSLQQRSGRSDVGLKDVALDTQKARARLAETIKNKQDARLKKTRKQGK